MTAEPDHTKLYAVVGELVMISNAIDHLLNQIVIEALHLKKSVMLEPILAELDPRRKIEILKSRAKLFGDTDWNKGITRFCDKTESVFKQRNIVCHTPAFFDGDTWAFKPFAAVKLLNKLDLKNKTLNNFSLNDIKTAISTGEAALGIGANLLENLKRFEPWLAANRAQSPGS
jgi:hypothetical protein